jgi:hypothetical protein
MLEFKLKNTIGEETKMFWKYQLAVWLSMQNFYSHFTEVTRNCECFGRIVESWHVPYLNLLMVGFMVFNATFNNISVILWQSVLLMEETGENHQPVTSHWQDL